MEQAIRPKPRNVKSTKTKTKKQNKIEQDVAATVMPEPHSSNGLNDETTRDDHTPSLDDENIAVNRDTETEKGSELSDTKNEEVGYEIADATNKLSLNKKGMCSPVVPGHFYKICNTKRDQDQESVNNFRQDGESPYALEEQSLESVEASAPHEDTSIDNTFSPSAPALFESSQFPSGGEFILDESLEDMISMEPVIESENERDDVLLPLQEDDWELATEQHVDHIYPSLEDGTIDENSSAMTPFTQEQLTMFYHNSLLDHADTYTDQFLTDSHEHDDRFKTLLLNYYQARLRLMKAKQQYDNHNKTIDTSVDNVFVTTKGDVYAEAYCQDQRKVNTVHRYDICHYDHEAGVRLSSLLREGRRMASEDVALACYSSTVARLHCEQCLFEVTERYKHHRNRLMEKTKSDTAMHSSILLQLVDESVAELKHIANVLFFFVRRKRSQEEMEDRFWSDIEKWIALIILHLLQSSDCSTSAGRHFSEEMFVMNHMLRCPPGVHQWGDGLVQVSGPSHTRDHAKDKTSLDHSICLLYLALRPPKGREEFLAELKPQGSSEITREKSNSTTGWTMIDDDGDEMDSLTSANRCLLPLENDLITIFRQIPLETLLSHVLQLSRFSDGSYHYSNANITSEDIMNTIAVCDLICDILGEGLATLGRPKYKQLVRRVAQAIRNIVLVVSQHWQHYKLSEEPVSNSHIFSVQRLQLEYDEFCKRCVSRLLAFAKLGIYQFIADLSYHTVSSRAAETMYLLMNVPPGVRSEVDDLVSAGYTKQEWLDFIQDPDTKLAFEEQLSTMPANEIVYLLTTFANLAQARPTNERHLVNTIAVDIFKVSFVYKSTRDICSKTGRELLCSVACYHSYIISTLIKFVQDNMESVLSVVIYALSDLPYSSWQPSESDMAILRNWFLTTDVSSTEFKLAQIVIQGLNYDYNTTLGRLAMSHSLHSSMAVMLVEACTRVMQDRSQAGFMMKSLDHVSNVASAVRLTSHPIHQQFISWSWKILLKLKLHHRLQTPPNSRTKTQKTQATQQLPDVPDINTDSSLLPVLQAAKDKQGMGCYVAITLTTVGHSMDTFIHDGLDYLHNLAADGHVRAVLSCLDCVIPIFYGTDINLAQNHRFTEALNCLLHATDEGFVSGLTNRLLTENNSQEYNSVTLLASVINNHVTQSGDEDGCMTILSYWLQMVLTIPGWFKDNHLRSLVDYIFKSATLSEEKCMLECRTLLYDNCVNLMLHSHNGNHAAQHRNVVSSLFHMVTGGNQHGPPSFISVIASNENVYFKYETLMAETRYEDDCDLWVTILSALRSDPKLSIESSVKRSTAKLKLSHTPVHSYLSVYRWGELALHTPHDHPLLPVIWYNFFLRFVYLPQDGGNSFGCRFFDPVSILPLYNKLRSRLQSSMEFHHGVISSKSVEANMLPKHEKLVKLYQSFKLWIEEPKIHECNLYMPSLPSQYNPGLLACVRTRNVTACKDAIDRSSVKKELGQLSEKWANLQKPSKSSTRNYKRYSYHRYRSTDDTQERMTQLLRQFEPPLEIPPHIKYGTWAPPVAIGDVASVCDYDAALREIDQDLKVLSSFADQFMRMQSKHQQINRDYLNILPHLYYLKDTELSVKIECQSAFSPTHKCTGPAQVDLRFKQKTINESASEKLDANRNLYKTEMDEFMNEKTSTELCYASLHMESVIRALEVNLKNPTHGEDLKRSVNDAGTRVFYLLADMYSGERSSCLPTKQLISAAVELLGQVFISQSHDQAIHILDQVLSNPTSAGLLSPHFAPGSKSGMSRDVCVREYIRMYQRVVKVVSTTKKDDPDILFVLLTKFEMGSWLNDLHPSLNDRAELLQYVVIGLVGCIAKSRHYDKKNSLTNDDLAEQKVLSNAITHKPSHSAVHEIYLNHFRSLLSYHFPDMLVDSVQYLLEASRTQDMTVETWEVLLAVAFNDKMMSPSAEKSENSVTTARYSSCVDWNTLQRTMELLTDYFGNFREIYTETKKSGLYVPWTPYVARLADMFSCICHTLLVFIRRDQLPLLYTETKLTTNPAWTALEPVYSLYYAWVQPTLDTGNMTLCWPWQDGDKRIVSFMTYSFNLVLRAFCHGNNSTVATYMSYIWGNYARTVLQEKRDVPGYMYDAYHAVIKDLPWRLFVPDLAALDQMIQLGDCGDDKPVRFLCYLVPKISWHSMIEMCHANSCVHQSSLHEDPVSDGKADEWNPVTGEILCRLLHLMFALGANPQRLTAYDELVALFAEVEAFPWNCINAEQIEYLANLVSDRYSWTSVLLYEDVKSHRRDPRSSALKLLKTVCRLPLVGEEKGNIKTPSSVLSLSIWSSHALPSNWLKRQSYIRCAGRLIQKMKPQEKGHVATVNKLLARFVERTTESIEMTSNEEDASQHLPSLLSVLLDYLNAFPSELQECVFCSIKSTIARKSFCKACAALSVSEKANKHCQDCMYMKSRALSPVTLLSCLTSICDTVSYAKYTCVLSETAIQNYLDTTIVDMEVTDERSPVETVSSYWQNISTSFHKPVTNYQEFMKQCLDNECVLTLHIHAMKTVILPGYYGDMAFLKMVLTPDDSRDQLYELAVSDVLWLSSIVPTSENESKLFVMWDHFMSICALLSKTAAISPDQGFTIHTITDTVASLLPVLEQVSVDKVKVGILGSIGIGRQSHLSTEFRLAARSLSVFIKQWLARLNPEYKDVISSAQKAFEALKNLPATNKTYVHFQTIIEEICHVLSVESLDLHEYRTFMSLLIKSNFSDKTYLKHILLAT